MYRYFCIMLLIFSGCKKINTVTTPEFEVSTTKTSYKAGEQVTFNFRGNPDVISFFSGETGNRYAYLERVHAAGQPALQFTSQRANGSQEGDLLILVSSDFAGVGADTATTIANIASAGWTDITSRATLSTGASTPSGAIDLTDIAAAGKPVYIAFRYKATAGSIQNKWTITGLTVTNTLSDSTKYTIANLSASAINNYGVTTTSSPGWVAYTTATTYKWTISSGSSLVVTGATAASAAIADSAAWAITGPVDLSKVTPDIGVAVKDITTSVPIYSYIYNNPGTYRVTFTAANFTTYGVKETVREMQLTITQ